MTEYKQPEASARLSIPFDWNVVALSKSGVHAYEQCPFRFYLQVIKEVEFEKTDDMTRGNMFHDAVFALYDGINTSAIETPDQLESAYRAFLIDWLVKNVEDKDMRSQVTFLLVKFTDIESKRFKAHIESGKPHNLFWPVYKEVALHDEELQFYGTADRVDYAGKNSYVVLDYKTGKFRDYSNMQSKYRFELAGYAHLINKFLLKKPERVTHICMVFLGGLENDPHVFYEELKFRTVNAFPEKVKRTRERIKNLLFPKKVSRLCEWCSYQVPCQTEQEGYREEDVRGPSD